jgi:hypothetical protein
MVKLLKNLSKKNDEKRKCGQCAVKDEGATVTSDEVDE